MPRRQLARGRHRRGGPPRRFRTDPPHLASGLRRDHVDGSLRGDAIHLRPGASSPSAQGRRDGRASRRSWTDGRLVGPSTPAARRPGQHGAPGSQGLGGGSTGPRPRVGLPPRARAGPRRQRHDARHDEGRRPLRLVRSLAGAGPNHGKPPPRHHRSPPRRHSVRHSPFGDPDPARGGRACPGSCLGRRVERGVRFGRAGSGTGGAPRPSGAYAQPRRTTGMAAWPRRAPSGHLARRERGPRPLPSLPPTDPATARHPALHDSLGPNRPAGGHQGHRRAPRALHTMVRCPCGSQPRGCPSPKHDSRSDRWSQKKVRPVQVRRNGCKERPPS